MNFFSRTQISEISSLTVHLSGPYSKIRTAQGTNQNQNAPFHLGPVQPYNKSVYHSSVTVLRTRLGWDDISTTWNKLKAKQKTNKRTNKQTNSGVLQDLFTPFSTDCGIREKEKQFAPHRPCTDFLIKRSFCYSGALLWNNFPQNISGGGGGGGVTECCCVAPAVMKYIMQLRKQPCEINKFKVLCRT